MGLIPIRRKALQESDWLIVPTLAVRRLRFRYHPSSQTYNVAIQHKQHESFGKHDGSDSSFQIALLPLCPKSGHRHYGFHRAYRDGASSPGVPSAPRYSRQVRPCPSRSRRYRRQSVSADRFPTSRLRQAG